MADTFKIPGMGDVPKKYVIGGVIAGIGVAVIVALRAKSAASSAAAAAAAAPASTDASGNDSAIDPSTGIPYADEESGADSSYDSGFGYGADSYGTDNTDVDSAGYPIGSAQDLAWQEQQTTGISSNDEWITEATSGTVPGNATTIAAALSAVLGGLTVTSAQQQLFMEAVGILGPPPQGYPTPIKTSDTAAQPAAGAAPAASNPPGGLSVTPYTTTADIGWTPVTGAASYHYQVQGGGKIAADSTTSATRASVSGLKAKTAYQARVSVTPSGHWTGWKSFTTK
jgi:hypothetical protein